MKILILDLETTGFLQAGGKIIEIGIVELNLLTGETNIVFDEVCHESGITKEEVERSWIVENSDMTVEEIQLSRNLEDMREEVQSILNKYENGATAYNNQFDFGFMEAKGFTFPKKLACPMKLATNVCKIEKARGYGYKWPKVQEAWDYFFGTETGYIEKHRGADDAFHEAKIVKKLYDLEVFTLN